MSTFTNLLYHIVYSTKHRQPLISADLRDDLYKYIGGIIRAQRGSLLEVGAMPDHIHLVTRFRTEPSIAEMLRLIKTNSSKWANERSGRTEEFAWQTGYATFTISESQLDTVRGYARRQEEHHRKMTFKDEYVELLRRHGIEYEERFLWD